jgi:hypothetical protein
MNTPNVSRKNSNLSIVNLKPLTEFGKVPRNSLFLITHLPVGNSAPLTLPPLQAVILALVISPKMVPSAALLDPALRSPISLASHMILRPAALNVSAVDVAVISPPGERFQVLADARLGRTSSARSARTVQKLNSNDFICLAPVDSLVIRSGEAVAHALHPGARCSVLPRDLRLLATPTPPRRLDYTAVIQGTQVGVRSLTDRGRALGRGRSRGM